MTTSNVSRARAEAARLELARRHPEDLAQWSEAYRRFDGEPMQLSPQQRELYRDNHRVIVIQKAAQVGISEYLINAALWCPYTGWGGRGNALYFLPTQVMADDFSRARIGKAIDESLLPLAGRAPRRRGRRGADRLSLRAVGPGHLYLRGTESDRALATIDADLVILDELDGMREGVYERAQARLGSSRAPLLRVASTPTLPNLGIHRLFELGNQQRWHVTCSGCGLEQAKSWEENIDTERALVVCGKCRKPLPLESEGRWIPSHPEQSDIHSYHLTKLDSRYADIPAMIEASRSSNPLVVDQFYQSDLGEPRTADGAGISVADLDECRGLPPIEPGERTVRIMGVDVGRQQYVVIRDWNIYTGENSAVFIGTVRTIDELPALMRKFRATWCCIDAQPETQKASEFRQTGRPRIYLALYDRHQPDHFRDKKMKVIHANRTQLFDMLYGAVRIGYLHLPENARTLGGHLRDGIGDYYRHLLALERVNERNRQGDIEARYDNANRPDHFAHAEAYCLLMWVTRFGGIRPGVM